jgi:endonuclease/exonuclease/phosphatase family metal-dependent hydrolase
VRRTVLACERKGGLELRIASFNVENLFQRAVAMSQGAGSAGEAAIVAQAKLNEVLRKARYTAADRARMLQLLADLGIDRKDDAGPFVILRQNRGQLVRRPKNKPPEIVAGGRGSWVGWVELKTEAVDEAATFNTARVIHEVNADVQAVMEVESRHVLRDFSRVMLRRVGGQPYEHSMVIQGNDDRGINVGLMTESGFTFETMRSHIFDLVKPNQPVFSRDCPEYLIRTPGGAEVLVLVNHFKSKLGGGGAKRLAQATRVKEIVEARLAQYPNLVVVGDLNDTPKSSALAPLLGTTLKDVSTISHFQDGGFPGTLGARDKIDYLLLSPALISKVTDGGIFRKGVFSGSGRWVFFDTITAESDQASDHAAIWADIDLP